METANRVHFHFPFTFHVKRNFTFRASVNVNDDGCSPSRLRLESALLLLELPPILVWVVS